MGVTIQIISGSKKSHGVEAKKIALLYLKPIVDTHKKEDVLKFNQAKMRGFDSIIFRYRDAPPELTPIIVHKFILSSNELDSVHIFTFESPESTWDENWDKYGTPILSQVNVIDALPAN